MIQFICDSCGTVKAPNELWVLGLAAEAVGITAARREVTILSGWARENAVHPLAVHFCSEECKDSYMNKLFAEPARTEVEVEEIVTTAKPRRVRRTVTAIKSRRKKKAA